MRSATSFASDLLPTEQLDHIEISPFGLHRPDPDEDLAIRGIVASDDGQRPYRAA